MEQNIRPDFSQGIESTAGDFQQFKVGYDWTPASPVIRKSVLIFGHFHSSLFADTECQQS